jgi:hypothetical protein
MLLKILLFCLLNPVYSVTTRVDYFEDNILTNINYFHLNKSIQIYDNYSLNDVFSLTHLSNENHLEKYELVAFVSLLPKFASPAIPFKHIINQINNYKIRSETFYTGLLSILYEEYDATNIIADFVYSVNNDLREFSEFTKSYCLDAVASIKQSGIFDTFDVDGYLRLKSGTDDDENSHMAKENNLFKQTNPAFIFSLGAAFLSGDFVTPFSIAADKLYSLNSAEAQAKETSASKAKTIKKNISKYDSDMWLVYSKLYCINTFSLSLVFIDDRLTIVGDKIPYEYFHTFMSAVQYNIEQHILLGSKDKSDTKDRSGTKDKSDTKDNFKTGILENVWQQLEAIKIVADKIEDLVVFEMFGKISDIVYGSFLNPIAVTKSYVSRKLSELDKLRNLLKKDFPILKKEMEAMEQMNFVLRQISDHIKAEKLIENNRKLNDTIFASEQRVNVNKVMNDIKNMEFEAMATFYVYGPLKRLTKLATRTVTVLPEGLAAGGLQGIYEFIGSVSSIFFGSPVTSVFLTIIGLSIVYSTVANAVSVVYNFVSWIVFPFLFIFKKIYRLF